MTAQLRAADSLRHAVRGDLRERWPGARCGMGESLDISGPIHAWCRRARCLGRGRVGGTRCLAADTIVTRLRGVVD